MHSNDPPILLILGLLFLLGLAADLVGRHTFVPRVTLLILAGLAVGPVGFDLLPEALVKDWFPPLTTLSMSLIGFLLGEKLSGAGLRAHGRQVIGITIGETTLALVAVALAMLAIGVHPAAALLLAGVAAVSAPAATFDVVRESGVKGEFTDTLLGVVALDGAVALLWFSLMMAAASGVEGGHSVLFGLSEGFREVGGSLVLGVILGVPMAYLTGRIRPGEPTLAEGIGFVLLCGGVASWLELSPVLCAMVMGAVVASLARHHHRPVHAIEGIEWPFLILFFILAGASARVSALLMVSGITVVYMLSRCIGTFAGARAGAAWARSSRPVRRWIGWCLFPQAGVALGMTLMAVQRFPDFTHLLLPVVLASTIIFEIVTPAVTRRALQAADAESVRESS